MPTFKITDENEPTTLRWPDADHGPWEVTLTWCARQDDVDCVGWSLQPLNPKTSAPISASLLRSVPVMKLIRQARRERFLGAGGADWRSIADAGHEQVAEQIRDESTTWRPRGEGAPRAHDEAFYKQVAKIYSDALLTASGRPEPLSALVAWQGGHIARSTVARWVSEARRAGFLPSTRPGRAAGNGERRGS